MKTRLKIVATVVLLLMAVGVWNLGLALLSAPSDLSLCGGVAIIGAEVVLFPTVLTLLWKRRKQ